MNYQRIRLDTWLKTYALNPEGHEIFFDWLKTLEVFKSVTLTLDSTESVTGTEVSITLENHGTNPAS
jgi:hypothetical protein